jgi:Sec-independent protein translocase protein TatA
VKRIPFLAIGALAVLGALALYILGENQLKEVAVAETEAVQAKNNTLRQFETKLKAEQKKADEEFAKSDAFQRLMASRFFTVMSLSSIGKSLLPGMWITSWENVPRKGDDDDSPLLTRLTIRGWRDSLSALESEHRKQNEGKKMTAEEIVAAAFKVLPIVDPKTVRIVSQKDVNSKGVLSEFAIELAFVPPPSADPSAKKPTGKKKKGARK